MKAWWLSSAWLLATTVAVAQTVPEDAPRPGKVLRDVDFGVTSSQFGLERRVEMYQWRVDGDAGAGNYQRVWNSARIDSSGFAPGHENPPDLPLDSQRWWSQQATLDGKPIDLAVLRTLGQWRGFRPNFSQLPGNLAATFQPEGDGLGSSENPLDPQIGDLRVGWSELVLPPLAGKVELRDGRWRLSPKAAAAVMPPAELTAEVSPPDPSTPRRWPWVVGGLLLVAGLLLASRRNRGRS
ncbi:TMEM43 family protein [Lysobacter koreensis]|uniref:TMEM43 family protein n=1 Tax=Lysobacter koreensis TaxID=266122 RepID=A0ABW2YPR8_9GAMM